jgi:UDP-N-acetylglucosamine diphosphorylase/glucosamine-1-phosphate N-acetyltransferase
LIEKIKAVVLFEDDCALTLEPLSLTRPVWALRCGLRTLEEKIKAQFTGVQFRYAARAYLQPLVQDAYRVGEFDAGDLLWVHGALLPGKKYPELKQLQSGEAVFIANRLCAFRGLPPADWRPGTELPAGGYDKIERTDDVGEMLRYPWQWVRAMISENEREARSLRNLGSQCEGMHDTVVLLKSADIAIAPGCQILPYVVLDATSGPVVLDEKVKIGAHAVIEGPTYIGPGTQVKPFTHIRSSCFGKECRVGGEISESILQGFTNKQHGGFLGNSFLGEWCNLGSGTETSNLKNNYTPVKVQIGKELVDTGQLFVGLTMGDHSKTAIGTVLNTGTVVGVACNIYGAGFPPRRIPSFHWWEGAEKLVKYPLHRTLEIAAAVMSRRARRLSDEEQEVLRWIHQNRSEP